MSHRPWPVPKHAWIMAQSWHDLLFAHWPIAIEQLRYRIPEPLEIDTYDGQAWIAVVPFRMSGIRFRNMPPIPWLSAFPEMNVRTYVRLNGKPGVYFFSLDASNPVAVEVARRWFHLPYFNARMSCQNINGRIEYESQRKASPVPAEFKGWYRPVGEPYVAKPGSLESWLVERYCLYAVDKEKGIHLGEIHHPPWQLQPAECEIQMNTTTAPLGITLPNVKPLLHFSKRQDVVVWAPSRIQ